MVWESIAQDGSDYGIFGQRYEPAGPRAAPSSGQQLHDGVQAARGHRREQGRVPRRLEACATARGRIIQGRRFDAAGAAIGGEFQVNTFTTASRACPTSAGPRTGASSWSGRARRDGTHTALSRGDSTRRGSPRRRVPGEQYTTPPAPRGPRGGAGNFVVAWESPGARVGEGARSSPGVSTRGQPARRRFRRQRYTTGLQTLPSVARRRGWLRRLLDQRARTGAGTGSSPSGSTRRGKAGQRVRREHRHHR